MKHRTATANGKNGSHWIRPEKRLALYLRDRFTCVYCLRDLHGADPRDITLDHLVCRGEGKADHSEGNLITACRCCNSSRQDKPLARFCGPETRAHIRRNTRRSLKPYLKLARAIIAGEMDLDDARGGAR
ncbi:MAG TPA: HNH endonuclease [Rubrobacteraceae bacterium]|nr:HNH endonuclease [Rubrobacteraceae bacterium]